MTVPGWATELRRSSWEHASLRRIATARDISFREPERGFVYWPGVPGEWEATTAIVVANAARNVERGRETHAMPSPAEVDLLRAMWFYDLDPELQVPVGVYDADFLFGEAALVVEVDGRVHDDRRSRDRARDRFFLGQGWKTMRVSGVAVWADPLLVARDVRRAVALELASVRPTPADPQFAHAATVPPGDGT